MKWNEMSEMTSNWAIDSLDSLETTFDKMAETEEDKDFCPHFVVFIDMVRCLVSRGWTVEELAKEVREHGVDQINYNILHNYEAENRPN